jgi:hypothetical protein
MEFLTKNAIETSTSLSVSTGTITAANMLTSDIRRQFRSDGDNSDSTTTTITVTFDAATTINRIALRETNFKNFRIFYDGLTANAFSLTTANTSTSSWSSNSATSLFLRTNDVTCSSVTLQCTETMEANREKALGQLILTSLDLELSRLPSAKDYDPLIDRNEVVHELSDGGSRLQFVRGRYSMKMKLKYVTEQLREDLRTIFNDDQTRIFCPFGTSTGWDNVIFDAIWVGNFDFLQYADDAIGAGFSGTISLKESHV